MQNSAILAAAIKSSGGKNMRALSPIQLRNSFLRNDKVDLGLINKFAY